MYNTIDIEIGSWLNRLHSCCCLLLLCKRDVALVSGSRCLFPSSACRIACGFGGFVFVEDVQLSICSSVRRHLLVWFLVFGGVSLMIRMSKLRHLHVR